MVLFVMAIVRVIRDDLIASGDIPSFIHGTAAMTRESLGILDDTRPNLNMLCRSVPRNVCPCQLSMLSPLESQKPGRSQMYAIDTVFLCPIDNHVTGNGHYFVSIVVELGASEAHSLSTSQWGGPVRGVNSGGIPTGS